MSKRLSEIYGMDIFTEKAEYVGKVGDIILNLDQGSIMQLSLAPLKHGAVDIRRALQEETISYEDVLKVGDIIICKKNPRKEGRGGREGKAPRSTI